MSSFPTFSGNTAIGNGWNAIYVRSGDITQTATWGSDLPYVAESISVHEGTVLTIAPGQIVKFKSYTSLTVNGSLIAGGAPDRPIVFTSYRDGHEPPAGMVSAESVGPSPGDWREIKFTDTSIDNECVLDYCVVKYAGYSGRAIYCENASPTISNCTIGYSSNKGIQCVNSKANLTGNTIRDNAGASVQRDLWQRKVWAIQW